MIKTLEQVESDWQKREQERKVKEFWTKEDGYRDKVNDYKEDVRITNLDNERI